MGQVISKSIKNHQSQKNDVVIQVTKKQLLTLFQLVMLSILIVINIIAIILNSPLMKELFISQAIIAAIFFIKNSKSNQVIK